MASRLEGMLSVQAAVSKVKATHQEQLSKLKEDEKLLFLQRQYQEQSKTRQQAETKEIVKDKVQKDFSALC